MKFCPQCRAQYEDDTNFCLHDGTPTVESVLSRQPTANYSEETLALPKVTIPPTQVVPLTNPQDAVPVSVETRVAPTAPQYQNAPRKSNAGLLIGLLLGGLLFVGAAVGGLLYLRSQKTDELATANTKKIDQTVSQGDNSNSSILNSAGSDVSINNANSETKTNTDNSAKPSPAVNSNIVKVTPSPKLTESPVKDSVIKDEEETEYSTPTPKNVPKTVSGGVVNGKATSLVKPTYPAAARAVRASGAVNVQVLIDENGNVISASAVSGHPLLRSSAVQAARASKFNPTLLSGQPVKVSGIIVYNFVAP